MHRIPEEVSDMPSRAYARPTVPHFPAATRLSALVVALGVIAQPLVAHAARGAAARSETYAHHRAMARRAECTPACPATTRCTPAPAVSAPGTAAMLIERDPESGGWRMAPSFALRPDDAAWALNQSSEGLRARPLAGGGAVVDLQGRFQNFSMARRTLDGRVQLGCAEDPAGAWWWMSGPVPTPAPAAWPER
jgi:hypothetical protein